MSLRAEQLCAATQILDVDALHEQRHQQRSRRWRECCKAAREQAAVMTVQKLVEEVDCCKVEQVVAEK